MSFKPPLLAGLITIGLFACKCAIGQTATNGNAGNAGIVIESIRLDPPNGATLPEQTPVVATIAFRVTKPADDVGVWVRILADAFKSQYLGSNERFQPGRHVVTRAAWLTEPGKLDKLTVVFKNARSTDIFRQDIAVNYTFVADPALEALKKVGIGSKITRVTFPDGKRATIKKGTYIPVVLDYAVNTEEGLFASAIPQTTCSHTYAGLAEPLRGKDAVEMGFTIGEPCTVKRVKVLLRNEAEGYVYEEMVDVDLTIQD